MIYYIGSDGSGGNVSVSNGRTDSYMYLLCGVQTGANYSVSIVALSQHLHSEVVSATEGKVLH